MCLQVFVGGQRKVIGLNIYLFPEHYLKAQSIAHIPDDPEKTRLINALLHKAKSRAENIFFDSMLKDKPLTKESFTEKFLHESTSGDFLKFMLVEIEKERKDKSPATIKTFFKTHRKLKSIFKTLSYQSVNLETIKKFNRELRVQKYETNTIAQFHKLFKKFVNIAILNGDLSRNPYDQYKITRARTHREYLSVEEVQLLIDYYKDSDLLSFEERRVLRYFLFMCFTGVRYQDVAALKMENIKGEYMEFRPKKTTRSLTNLRIELNKAAKHLILDSLHSSAKKENGKVFDCIANQKTNEKLKIIANRCGIEKNISCHVSRHTFATTFLASGGKIEVLQDLLGHENIKTTQIYVHIASKQKQLMLNDMSELFKF